MIDRGCGLSLSRQYELLDVSRSSQCYAPAGESAENLALMRRLDELHLEHGCRTGFSAPRLDPAGTRASPAGRPERRAAESDTPRLSPGRRGAGGFARGSVGEGSGRRAGQWGAEGRGTKW